MEDAIDDAIKNNERLFLSHFTSTTHHPWALPKGVQSEQYFSDESLIGKHEDMNSYLNSVRYVDAWLGDMLGLLDKKGIANETLVVFVGDQ
jgi:phosphoglycerol transferase MdoB-like AlkP superfamily enzyme